MEQLEQRFQVTYQYPVFFTDRIFEQDNITFSQFIQRSDGPGAQKKLLFVLDRGLQPHYPRLQEAILSYVRFHLPDHEPVITNLPGGEEGKNDQRHVKELVAWVEKHKVDRHSYMIGVGGGALLDVTGFAAAIAHRGIRHIRIPTTVLSQNDSGIGVKNGINFFGKKNFLGTFAPPVAVFNDNHFLHTLDNRHWRGGMAEAVKVALIKDAVFFQWLEAHAALLADRDSEAMAYLVYRCAALHLQHIASGDPFESGSSRPLDFGHWSAHKLEQLSDYALSHGDAVAIGIALDAVYSEAIGWLTAPETERILKLLQKLGFALYHPLLEAQQALLSGLSEFREHLGGRLTIMLLRAIGQGENVHEMHHETVYQSVGQLKQYQPLLIS